ncbi:MAG: hypothetical protein JXX28_08590 [Deltaproteobacteria bacterium]|nr:hypothetical protein [Deltaproteobacteria bacterium]
MVAALEEDEPDERTRATRVEWLLGRASGPVDFAVAALRWGCDLSSGSGDAALRLWGRAHAQKGVSTRRDAPLRR